MEPLIHFAIPFALASILHLKPKWAVTAGVFGVLPDLDIFTFMHRSVSHTILPPLAILLILIPSKRARANLPLLTLCLGWGTHILLDFISGYTPILWPLFMNSYRLVLESTIHMGSTPIISARLNILQEPYNYGAFTTLDTPIFTAEGLAIALTLTILTLTISRGGFKIVRRSIEAEPKTSSLQGGQTLSKNMHIGKSGPRHSKSSSPQMREREPWSLGKSDS